jgi:putative ABC transport system permease protein
MPDPKTFSHIYSGADTYFESFARNFSRGSEDPRSSTLIGILVLLAVMFIVLPTINLVNINISRIMERASEIGVRKAFGASSITLVGQFIIENVLLTIAGGLIGFALSYVILYYFNSTGWIPYAQFGLNYRVFIYGFIMMIIFGIISGVYPAWRMSRLHPVQALKGGAQ